MLTNAIKLLTNTQTAEMIGVRPSTLEIWRLKAKGPQFRKIGRLVRYAEHDVIAWLDAQVYTSTSQVSAQYAPI